MCRVCRRGQSGSVLGELGWGWGYCTCFSLTCWFWVCFQPCREKDYIALAGLRLIKAEGTLTMCRWFKWMHVIWLGFVWGKTKIKNNTKCMIKRECFSSHMMSVLQKNIMIGWCMQKQKVHFFLLHDVCTLCGNIHAQSAVRIFFFFSYELFMWGKKVCKGLWC